MDAFSRIHSVNFADAHGVIEAPRSERAGCDERGADGRGSLAAAGYPVARARRDSGRSPRARTRPGPRIHRHDRMHNVACTPHIPARAKRPRAHAQASIACHARAPARGNERLGHTISTASRSPPREERAPTMPHGERGADAGTQPGRGPRGSRGDPSSLRRRYRALEVGETRSPRGRARATGYPAAARDPVTEAPRESPKAPSPRGLQSRHHKLAAPKISVTPSRTRTLNNLNHDITNSRRPRSQSSHKHSLRHEAINPARRSCAAAVPRPAAAPVRLPYCPPYGGPCASPAAGSAPQGARG